MASPINAILCALIATAFWTLLGYALARHLLPRVLALGAAPVIGWAVHSAVTLPIFLWIGLSPMTVVAVGALCVRRRLFAVAAGTPDEAEDAPAIRHGHSPPPRFWRWCRPSRSCRNITAGRSTRRSDLRSFQDRDHRRDGAARPAARQSGLRRRPVRRPARLLLSLAFQRRRAGTAAPRQRLGSRYRAYLVHRLCLADA